jgi:hypothetical protein
MSALLYCRARKSVGRWLLVLGMVGSLAWATTYSVWGASLTSKNVSLSNNLASATSSWTTSFVTASGGTIDSVVLEFETGVNVSGASLGSVSGIGLGTIGISGQRVTYTVTVPAFVPASTAISIQLTGVVNPSTIKSYAVFAQTQLAGPVALDNGSTLAYLDTDGVAGGLTTNQVLVSATVTSADSTPPDDFDLISPANSSYVNTNTPSFTWEASSDAFGIGKYQLSINNSLYIDNIPTNNTDTVNYTLTYDSLNQRYTLTLKSPVALADGSYSWRIRAEDTNGNGTDSVTWNFTVDTVPPPLVVTSIGDTATSISSGSEPTEPVETPNNPPIISGTTEAGRTVTVTITLPDNTTYVLTTTADANGDWSVTPPLLPRDVTILLTVTATDAAGNTRTITDAPFTIPTPVIVFPPQPTPSPSPTPIFPEPTPSPIIDPETGLVIIPTPSPSPSPTASPRPPFLVIPLINPLEIIGLQLQELREILPEIVVQTIETIAPVAVPAAATIATTQIAFEGILRVLQLIGLFPVKRTTGYVFDSQTKQPVPFAVITITSVDQRADSIQETVVSNMYGMYTGIQLPLGKYKLEVRHQDYLFPSREPRPAFLSVRDYYLGEVFEVTNAKIQQFFLVPMDPLGTVKEKRSLRYQANLLYLWFNRLLQVMIVPLFLLSVYLTSLSPSPLSFFFLLIYTLLLIRQLITVATRPNIVGKIADDQETPVENVLVRLNQAETGELQSVMLTDKRGKYATRLKKDRFQLSIVKPGMVWTDGQQPMSSYEADTRFGRVRLTHTLKPVNVSAEEFFTPRPIDPQS